MKKIFLFLMVMVSLCSSAFAESMDDVLKDCKLDRNRWKVVEWFKAEKFVRFYDSQSVSVTDPGQFDVIIYDYYYGDACIKENCKQHGKKHYHSEKWRFDTKKSTGTICLFGTKDADENVLDSYEYPSNLQIPVDVKRNSVEGKTMLKVKEFVKSDKKFTIQETNPSIASGNYKVLAEEIKKSETELLQQNMPDVTVDYPNNYEQRMAALIAAEKKILTGVEANNIKLEELRRLAKNERIKDEEVASFINSVQQNRINWVKKVSAKRMYSAATMYRGDTIRGVGVGNTWEEIQVVFGKPKFVDKRPGGLSYDYDGIRFSAWMGGGKDADPSKWKSDRAMSWEMTDSSCVSDYGIRFGTSFGQFIENLSRHGRLTKTRERDGVVRICYIVGKMNGYDSVSEPSCAKFTDGKISYYGVGTYYY